jgi:hypothetical protein
MPRVGGPLENDEELDRSRQAVTDGMREENGYTNDAATAIGLLYVGDCIRVAVDALIAVMPKQACNVYLIKKGEQTPFGRCVLPAGHDGLHSCQSRTELVEVE